MRKHKYIRKQVMHKKTITIKTGNTGKSNQGRQAYSSLLYRLSYPDHVCTLHSTLIGNKSVMLKPLNSPLPKLQQFGTNSENPYSAALSQATVYSGFKLLSSNEDILLQRPSSLLSGVWTALWYLFSPWAVLQKKCQRIRVGSLCFIPCIRPAKCANPQEVPTAKNRLAPPKQTSQSTLKYDSQEEGRDEKLTAKKELLVILYQWKAGTFGRLSGANRSAAATRLTGLQWRRDAKCGSLPSGKQMRLQASCIFPNWNYVFTLWFIPTPRREICFPVTTNCVILRNRDVRSKLKLFLNRLWRPIGLWDVEDPTLSRQLANGWHQCCQPYAPAALYSPETLFFCFR
jgi:hypothetical protein